MSEQLGRLLLVVGALIAAAGGVVLLASRLGIGRFPGDIVWEGEGWRVYVPLGWMVVLSVALTLLLSLLSRR